MWKAIVIVMLNGGAFFGGNVLAQDVMSVKLTRPVANAPAVVEFFSFYCPPCYQFAFQYDVVNAINAVLPVGQTVMKYHVGAMGALGRELTEAWSIALSLGIVDKVEQPLFEAIHVTRTLNTNDDIEMIFMRVGVTQEEYRSARNSFTVKAITQMQMQAVEDFSVSSTPSVFVAGSYQIVNLAILGTTPATYRLAFADVVRGLLASGSVRTRQ